MGSNLALSNDKKGQADLKEALQYFKQHPKAQISPSHFTVIENGHTEGATNCVYTIPQKHGHTSLHLTAYNDIYSIPPELRLHLKNIVGPKEARKLGMVNRAGNQELVADRIKKGITLNMAKVGDDATALSKFFIRHKGMKSLTITNYNHQTFIKALSELGDDVIFIDLRSFRINSNLRTPSFIADLLQHFFRRTPNLTSLDLWRCHINEQESLLVAQSGTLKNLTHLNLSNNNISDKGVEAIALSQILQSLTHLNLSSNNIGDMGVEAIALSQILQSLTHLILGGNNIGSTGAAAIAKSKTLKNLEELNVSHSKIGESGVAAIVQSQALQNLKELSLSGNQINDKTAETVLHTLNLRHLTYLSLTMNPITRDVRKKLYERFGNVLGI